MNEENPERLLLGAVLAGWRHVTTLTSTVDPVDFDEPKHELIWRAIVDVVEAGESPEPLRVSTRLGRDVRKLPDGALFLTTLASEARKPESAEFYAQEVTKAARRRRLNHLATRIHQMANDPAYDDVDVLTADVRTALEEATTGRTMGRLRTIGDAMPGLIDIAQNGHPNGLSTPWYSIDRLTRGLQAGRLLVVGARPGVGKSVMGANLAHHVALKHQAPVFFASMEMSFVELSQRIVAHHASISLGKLDDGRLNEGDWERLRAHHDAVSGLPIHFDDRGSQNLASIRTHVRNMEKTGGIGLVVVDYLQQLNARDSSRNRSEQVQEFSRGLKILARDFNVPVVAMAQLNRGSTQRQNGKPTMSDLRESGGIEADADVVLLLHRDADEEADDGRIQVLIEKNRSGPRGATTLDFWGNYARLAEYAPHTPRPS
jgi:replicative DNA helicase